MARRILTVSIIGLLFFAGLPGCSSDQEKAVDKQIALMNEFADKLESIKSNTDLVSAKPDLEKLGAKMKDLANDEKKLPKPTADETAALEKKYKPDEDKASARIQEQMTRLAKDVSPTAPFEIMEAMKVEDMGSSPFMPSPKMPM
jgi:hypothetical protein